MKKIILALAMIGVGAIHAASLDWSIGNKSFLMSDGTTYPKATTVYVLDTGATAYSTLSTILSTGTGGAAEYANLNAVLSGTEFSAVQVGSGTTFSGSNNQMKQKYGSASGTVTVANDNTSYSLAIFVTDGEKYLLSSPSSGLSYTSSPDDGEAAMFGAAGFSAGWKTYEPSGTPVVPEPTSGILLLIGGAVLSLRRKQK